MADISFEFVEKSTVKVKEKCYIAVLMVNSEECASFEEGELYRNYDSLDAVSEDFAKTTTTYKMCQAWFANTNKPIIIAAKSAQTYSDSLSLLCEQNDWFGVVLIESNDKADIVDVATWCEIKNKIFWTQSSEADILNSVSITDTPYVLHTSNYRWTGITQADTSELAENYPSIVSMARQIGKRPGSWSVCNKGDDWVGVKPGKYTSNQEQTLINKCCNYYYVDRTQGYKRNNFKYGVMANGDSLFQRRNIMWFNDEIMTRSYQMEFDADVLLRAPTTTTKLQRMLVELFTEAVQNNVCYAASKAEFAKKLGIDESEVENYNPNGFIMNLPDIMNDENWESTGKGQFKYKNIVFDVMMQGIINQFEGTIILRKL